MNSAFESEIVRRRPPMNLGNKAAIDVRNAQRAITVSIETLRAFAHIALELAWPRRLAGADIVTASSIVVSVVSDRRMADLHSKFCGIAGPTDVLTFQHGEIIISAQTAARNARRFHTSSEHELRLYLLHGLLHLCGYDDKSESERAKMERAQKELFREATRAAREDACHREG